MTTPSIASPTTDDPLVGQTIARQFRIERRLGGGGMGAVYLAEQLDMGRQVVIKVMHPELTLGNPSAVERFKREARAVATLNHPHIVQVHVFGQTETGQLYQAMELIEGHDLAAEIARGALDQARALHILAQVADALEDAHRCDIVHRDLKPENIMLVDRHGDPDWVKVLDFGIAKVGHTAGVEPALTKTGAIFGTPRYMAPEQIQGGPVDARTDLYALGVVLYEMLTGEHPFHATSVIDYFVKHVQEPVVAAGVRIPGLAIDPRTEAMLARLLAKAPADRYPSAGELAAAAHALAVELGHAVPTATASPARGRLTAAPRASITAAPEGPPKRGRKTWPIVVALVLLVGGGAAVMGVFAGAKAPAEAPLAASSEATPAASARIPAPAAPPAATPTPAPTEATPAPSEPPSAAAAPEPTPVPEPLAGMPIEGFPVPERTTLKTTTPSGIRLESPLAPAAVRAFYAKALSGRATPSEAGFTLTTPPDVDWPWTAIYISSTGEPTVIDVARNSERSAAERGHSNSERSAAERHNNSLPKPRTAPPKASSTATPSATSPPPDRADATPKSPATPATPVAAEPPPKRLPTLERPRIQPSVKPLPGRPRASRTP